MISLFPPQHRVPGASSDTHTTASTPPTPPTPVLTLDSHLLTTAAMPTQHGGANAGQRVSPGVSANIHGPTSHTQR